MAGRTLFKKAAAVVQGLAPSVNDKPVSSVTRLLARLDDFAPGDKVRLRVLRGDCEIEVDIFLASDRS
jgi:S1-C subfamily serine protease